MTSATWRGIGVLTAAVLFTGSLGIAQSHAQASNTATQQADSKKKATEKKDTAKPEAQTNSGKSAPMSGFRPDPQSNY